MTFTTLALDSDLAKIRTRRELIREIPLRGAKTRASRHIRLERSQPRISRDPPIRKPPRAQPWYPLVTGVGNPAIYGPEVCSFFERGK